MKPRKATVIIPKIDVPCVTFYKDDIRKLPFNNVLSKDCDYIVFKFKQDKKITQFELWDENGYICNMDVETKLFNNYVTVDEIIDNYKF